MKRKKKENISKQNIIQEQLKFSSCVNNKTRGGGGTTTSIRTKNNHKPFKIIEMFLVLLISFPAEMNMKSQMKIFQVYKF